MFMYVLVFGFPSTLKVVFYLSQSLTIFNLFFVQYTIAQMLFLQSLEGMIILFCVILIIMFAKRFARKIFTSLCGWVSSNRVHLNCSSCRRLRKWHGDTNRHKHQPFCRVMCDSNFSQYFSLKHTLSDTFIKR